MHAYVKKLESDSMSVNYVAITAMSLNTETNIFEEVDMKEFPKQNELYPYEYKDLTKIQNLSEDYVDYIENNINGSTEEKSLVTGIKYTRNIQFYKTDSKTKLTDWAEIIDNPNFLKDNYTTLASINDKVIPTQKDEVCLVVDKYNRIKTSILDDLSVEYDKELSALNYEEFIGKTIDIVYKFENEDLGIVLKQNYQVKIISILREKENIASNWLNSGIGYSKALAEDVCDFAGPVTAVASIFIYPKDFESKEKIVDVLDHWNNTEIYQRYGNEKDSDGNFVADQYKVDYTDISELLTGFLSDLIDITTYTLVAFSSVSLIVSSIMIAIITYASVIERIKEIGTIRSLGGRKKDVANIFRTEACIIGGVSAIIALIVTLIINMVINIILGNLVGVTTIAKLSWGTALGMTALSIGLNLIASLIPANIAAKKDPVLALRSE